MRYDPWGNPAASSGTLPDWRYQGSWRDADTAMYWVVARWYAPSLGAFASEDPLLAEASGGHAQPAYAYAGGDPINHIDDNGLNWYIVPGDGTLQNMAFRVWGTRSKWPLIYNQNRNRMPEGPWGSHLGKCVYIPKNVDALRTCKPANYTVTGGNKKAHLAAKTLQVDVGYNGLTQDTLEDLTEALTGYKRKSDVGDYLRYIANVTPANVVAFGIAAGCHANTFQWRGVTIAWGDGCPPPDGQRGWTLGQYIFVRGSDPGDSAIMAHEFVHTLQYQGIPNFASAISHEAIVENMGWGPENRFEALGYLWEGWARDFQDYGGTFRYPWMKFR